MPDNIRPLAKPRPYDRKAYALRVACEIRELTAALGANGWTLSRICSELSVSSEALYKYRIGSDEPKAGVLEALRDLVAENVRKAAGQ